MVTKTLTITEDAYGLLKNNKLESESFSEEIKRLLSPGKKRNLSDYFGILSEEEGAKIELALKKKRAINLKHVKGRLKQWQ